MINMKKTLLIFALALLAVTQMAAQDYDYIPFVREGVKWVCDNRYWEGDKYKHHYFTLEFRGDSVINGKTYKVMHKYSGQAIDPANDTIPVFMREDNKVVYGIVPDGKTYMDCPVGVNKLPETLDIIASGQEFVLYDFNNPIEFIKNNIKIMNSGDGYQADVIIPDKVLISGNEVNRYIFGHGNSWCFIEGIGCDGLFYGYPLSPMYDKNLCHVIENGDTIYSTERFDTGVWDENVRTLPIPRQGVQWVNERVIVDHGDTTRYYYKYEFNGTNSQGYALCYYYLGDTLNKSDASLVAKYQCSWYLLNSSNGSIIDNVPFSKIKKANRNMVSYTTGVRDVWRMYQFERYVSDIDIAYTPNFYIYRQRENFLTRENFVKVESLTIEDIECERFAYVGEQGDTLAYVVEGIGFDSRDMGDLLTPFTRKPDPSADYQEWCGLSHVVKDGQIIYKGMRYRDGALDGIDEVVADKSPRSLDDNYYNLMGQPVGKNLPTLPGIYIHHGNKILVR